MDQMRDFDNFKRLVMRLCVTFDKFANEELIETWWKCLRREDFKRVEAGIEAFIAKADDRTKFPKPGLFAGYVDSVGREHAANRVSQKNWERFCRDFPKTGPLRLRLHQASRIMAEVDESSPQYSEAQKEYFALEKLLGPNGRFSADA